MNIVLLRGTCWMKWKLSSQVNSKSFPTHPKQKHPAGHCPTLPESTPNSNSLHRNSQPDIVRHPQTLSGSWIWAQQLDSLESPIYTNTPPTALLSWLLHFPIEQALILNSKRSNSLSPRAFIPSFCVEIEWSKDLSSLCDSPPQTRLGCWIFILRAYYSWRFAPRRLEVSLELLLCVVIFEKFVLHMLW
jgi:hypothetical protein